MIVIDHWNNIREASCRHETVSAFNILEEEVTQIVDCLKRYLIDWQESVISAIYESMEKACKQLVGVARQMFGEKCIHQVLILEALVSLSFQSFRYQSMLAGLIEIQLVLQGKSIFLPYVEAKLLQRIGQTHELLKNLKSANQFFNCAISIIERYSRCQVSFDRYLDQLYHEKSMLFFENGIQCSAIDYQKKRLSVIPARYPGKRIGVLVIISSIYFSAEDFIKQRHYLEIAQCWLKKITKNTGFFSLSMQLNSTQILVAIADSYRKEEIYDKAMERNLEALAHIERIEQGWQFRACLNLRKGEGNKELEINIDNKEDMYENGAVFDELQFNSDESIFIIEEEDNLEQESDMELNDSDVSEYLEELLYDQFVNEEELQQDYLIENQSQDSLLMNSKLISLPRILFPQIRSKPFKHYRQLFEPYFQVDRKSFFIPVLQDIDEGREKARFFISAGEVFSRNNLELPRQNMLMKVKNIVIQEKDKNWEEQASDIDMMIKQHLRDIDMKQDSPLAAKNIYGEVVFSNLIDSDIICSICLNSFQSNKGLVRSLPCKHFIHKKFIERWIIENNSCPLCRGCVVLPPYFINEDNRIELAKCYVNQGQKIINQGAKKFMILPETTQNHTEEKGNQFFKETQIITEEQSSYEISEELL